MSVNVYSNGTLTPIAGNAGGGGASTNYSANEQKIGTWIDGKPVYSITISSTTPSSDGAVPNTVISNLKKLISMVQRVEDSNGNQEAIASSYGAYLTFYYSPSSGVNVLYGNGADWAKNRQISITFEYTKTTD